MLSFLLGLSVLSRYEAGMLKSSTITVLEFISVLMLISIYETGHPNIWCMYS